MHWWHNFLSKIPERVLNSAIKFPSIFGFFSNGIANLVLILLATVPKFWHNLFTDHHFYHPLRWRPLLEMFLSQSFSYNTEAAFCVVLYLQLMTQLTNQSHIFCVLICCPVDRFSFYYIPEMPWSRALWLAIFWCRFLFLWCRSLLSFYRHRAEFCHASQPEANEQKETRSQPPSLPLILESQWQQLQHKEHNITDIFCVVLIAVTDYWGKKQASYSKCPSPNTIWMQNKTPISRY